MAGGEPRVDGALRGGWLGGYSPNRIAGLGRSGAQWRRRRVSARAVGGNGEVVGDQTRSEWNDASSRQVERKMEKKRRARRKEQRVMVD
jgi:hypothetical protein